MAAAELEAEAVLAALERRGVNFVLIGGLAAVVHGSPFVTEEVDITPEATRANLAQLSEALRDLDARVWTGAGDTLPFAHDADSPARPLLEPDHEARDLDISMQPAGTEDYDDLVRDAEPTPIFGLTIAVASLADIIRSKQAANRPKDQRVLPTLREFLAGSAASPDDGVAPCLLRTVPNPRAAAAPSRDPQRSP